MKKAYFHLPGLFEFYQLYKLFLPLFYEHREYFYDWCEIGSIYGAPADCLWGGGRIEYGEVSSEKVLKLLCEYGISARLTFSNSLLTDEHLRDEECNRLCKLFNAVGPGENGVIIYSDLLLDYIKDKYPNLYFVSSTTKVLTRFEDLKLELARKDFKYVVPDFRLNKAWDKLNSLSARDREKIEFLCNECCDFSCKTRKECYESVSRICLGGCCDDAQVNNPGGLCEDENLSIQSEGYKDAGVNFACSSIHSKEGYVFSKAMENPGFIGIDDIKGKYLNSGFSNFKIEGRGLGSALVLEFLLYYLTKPECQLKVREAIYLNHSLDLF